MVEYGLAAGEACGAAGHALGAVHGGLCWTADWRQRLAAAGGARMGLRAGGRGCGSELTGERARALAPAPACARMLCRP